MLAGRVAAKNRTVKATAVVLKHVAMVFAAPIFGLAYVILFPFIGLATLAWMAGRPCWRGPEIECEWPTEPSGGHARGRAFFHSISGLKAVFWRER